MVVGRVVGLDGGKLVIETPPGPRPSNWSRIEALIAAARAYKADRNEDTLYALSQAAKEID